MKWQKERDDLIAQTKAFVQSVTGRTPQAVLGPVFNKAAPTEDPFAALFPDPVSPPPLPIKHVVAADPAETKPLEAKAPEVNAPEAKPPEQVEPTIDVPTLKAPSQSDVRKEIQTRVAAFQAHQHRFHRERDAYFNAVLTKARSAIQDEPDIPSS
jgi:hypothetical protein